VLIPPSRLHKISNPWTHTARVVAVTSPASMEAATRPHDESLQSLDELLARLDGPLDNVAAIQTIIKLFDIGGRLTDQIERCVGLDNDTGVDAVMSLQKRLMTAVVEVTRRYRGDACE
jgi:hypothetical protein